MASNSPGGDEKMSSEKNINKRQKVISSPSASGHRARAGARGVGQVRLRRAALARRGQVAHLAIAADTSATRLAQKPGAADPATALIFSSSLSSLASSSFFSGEKSAASAGTILPASGLVGRRPLLLDRGPGCTPRPPPDVRDGRERRTSPGLPSTPRGALG